MGTTEGLGSVFFPGPTEADDIHVTWQRTRFSTKLL
jgi:hypothetical protein